MLIGVLALQGAFIEHENILKRLNVSFFEIRNKDDLLKPFDGLIIPGGESTVIGKLLQELGMLEILKDKIEHGFPVFGTCAGMILLAKKIARQDVTYLSTMNIKVKRNAYGRQLGSFYTESIFANYEKVKMPFIRAPYIESVGDDVEVLSQVDNHIVGARQGNQLVISFHPELVDEERIHLFFIEIVKNYLISIK